MSLRIDMTRAVTGSGSGPKLSAILDNIKLLPTDDDQILSCLKCFSRTLSLNGQKKVECVGVLSTNLFELAKKFPQETQEIINMGKVKNNPYLTETVKKLDYLSGGLFGYHNRFTNYSSKFFHHLKQSYGENKHFGASFLTAGASLLLSNGLINALSDDPESTYDDVKVRTGWGMVGTGGVLIVYPFFNAMKLALGDEP